MAKLTMDVKRNRIILGIGLAIIFYFGVKKFYKPKISGSNVNFSNANGGEFVAKRFDASRNATWISYNNSDVVGFWKDGNIPEGTSVEA
jgi:hypothetical protein